MDSYNQHMAEGEAVSLKDLILLAKTYFFEVLKFWWLIGIFAILLGGYFFYKASKKATKYSATVTYTTSEGGGIGGLAGGLIGRFVGKSNSSQVEKMQAMLSSRQIMQNVLFHKTEIDGEEDYLINHHFKIHKFKDDDGNQIIFKTADLNTPEKRKLFKTVHSQINKGLLTTDINSETGIAEISIKSKSEEYSFELSKTLYKKLEEFYVESEVGEQQKTLDLLQHRADSLYGVINGKAATVARLQDQDKGRFRATDLLPEGKAQTEFEFLRQVYSEVLRNLETVRFSVSTSTPSIKVIDYPMLPLTPEKGSVINRGIIGALIGAVLVIFLVIARKVFIDIMKEDEAPQTA